MKLEIEHREVPIAVLRVEGRLDLVSASELRETVHRVVAEGRHTIVLDLTAVTFVDSSGIGALVGGLREARQAGGELRIAGAGEQVRTVLQLTRVDRVLKPYDGVEAALEDL